MAKALKVADKKVLLVLPEGNPNAAAVVPQYPLGKAYAGTANICTYEVMNAYVLVMVEGAENVLNIMLA